MSATDPVYRQGVDYLLRTQAADGTWQVKSRPIWLQPYFESLTGRISSSRPRERRGRRWR
jgi:hypothetical protein